LDASQVLQFVLISTLYYILTFWGGEFSINIYSRRNANFCRNTSSP
jgi:hypothetical protein